MLSIEQSLWRPLCLHSTTTVPLNHFGNGSAPIQLLCATCCAITAALVVQGRHKGRVVAVTETKFLRFGDHWASIFLVGQRWCEGRISVYRGLKQGSRVTSCIFIRALDRSNTASMIKPFHVKWITVGTWMQGILSIVHFNSKFVKKSLVTNNLSVLM